MLVLSSVCSIDREYAEEDEMKRTAEWSIVTGTMGGTTFTLAVVNNNLKANTFVIAEALGHLYNDIRINNESTNYGLDKEVTK
jgi:hypothetical protein